MKLTGTNRPTTYNHTSLVNPPFKRGSPSTVGKKTCMHASTLRFPTNKPTNGFHPRETPSTKKCTIQLHTRNTKTLHTTPTHTQGGGPVKKSYGGHSVGETPGPIPNPEAKTHSAHGTALARVWESRTPPDNTTREDLPAKTPEGLRHLKQQHHKRTPPGTTRHRNSQGNSRNNNGGQLRTKMIPCLTATPF